MSESPVPRVAPEQTLTEAERAEIERVIGANWASPDFARVFATKIWVAARAYDPDQHEPHKHVSERQGSHTACMRCGLMPDAPVHSGVSL